MQINSVHLVKSIRTSVCLRKAFQKSGFGKWLEPWKFYEFVSSNRTTAAWTISFSEKRAAVSLCRLFLCSRWNLPLRCWQSQMKLKVSWIGSFDKLPMRCELTIFDSLQTFNLTQENDTAIANQVQYATDIRHILSRIVSTMVSTGLKVYISDFEETPHSKNSNTSAFAAPRSTFSLHFLNWILNPIHPAYKHAFKSHPYDISTLISWVSADISTASPFCKAGIFVSSSWVLYRMMCPMCP